VCQQHQCSNAVGRVTGKEPDLENFIPAVSRSFQGHDLTYGSMATENWRLNKKKLILVVVVMAGARLR